MDQELPLFGRLLQYQGWQGHCDPYGTADHQRLRPGQHVGLPIHHPQSSWPDYASTFDLSEFEQAQFRRSRIVSDYTLELSDISKSLPGSLNFVLNATYTIKLTTTDATGFVTRYDGWTGNPGTVQSVFGVPKWRADGVITYSADRYSLSAHGRYIGPGVYDPTKIGPEQAGYSANLANSINYNRVSSRLYWDLTAAIDIMKSERGQLQVFGSVFNLFDKDPPRLRLYGNPVLFDAIGRAYRAGIRVRF